MSYRKRVIDGAVDYYGKHQIVLEDVKAVFSFLLLVALIIILMGLTN